MSTTCLATDLLSAIFSNYLPLLFVLALKEIILQCPGPATHDSVHLAPIMAVQLPWQRRWLALVYRLWNFLDLGLRTHFGMTLLNRWPRIRDRLARSGMVTDAPTELTLGLLNTRSRSPPGRGSSGSHSGSGRGGGMASRSRSPPGCGGSAPVLRGPIQIVVIALAHYMVTLDVDLSSTIAYVKLLIEEKQALHPEHQRLTFQSTVLSNEHSLAYYGIKSGSVLFLLQTGPAVAVLNDLAARMIEPAVHACIDTHRYTYVYIHTSWVFVVVVVVGLTPPPPQTPMMYAYLHIYRFIFIGPRDHPKRIRLEIRYIYILKRNHSPSAIRHPGGYLPAGLASLDQYEQLAGRCGDGVHEHHDRPDAQPRDVLGSCPVHSHGTDVPGHGPGSGHVAADGSAGMEVLASNQYRIWWCHLWELFASMSNISLCGVSVWNLRVGQPYDADMSLYCRRCMCVSVCTHTRLC